MLILLLYYLLWSRVCKGKVRHAFNRFSTITKPCLLNAYPPCNFSSADGYCGNLHILLILKIMNAYEI